MKIKENKENHLKEMMTHGLISILMKNLKLIRQLAKHYMM